MPKMPEPVLLSYPTADLALRMLRLEQQLDSYQRLHAAELEDLRQALTRVKDEVLALALQTGIPDLRGETS